jgi:hypothetical protein
MAKSSAPLENTPNHPVLSLEDRLRQHPELKAKIESILAVVENAQGDIKTANEAEQFVIEEIQKLGQAALQGWADQTHQQQQQDFKTTHPQAHRSGKKNSTGIPDSAPLPSLNKPTNSRKGAL